MGRQQLGRVQGNSSNGADEVQGNSNGADGVQGRSDGVDGVQGNSNGADGVQGNSNGADGVQGNSNGADGAPPGARRLRLIGSELGRKMRSMSFKVKEVFQGPNPHAIYKLVEDATSESLDEPDWYLNHHICDMLNHHKVKPVDLLRGIKRRMMLKSPAVHHLSLLLLETLLHKCDKAFSESEVAAQSVLHKIIQLAYDKLVADATSEALDDPDWALNLGICDIFNKEKGSNVDFIRGIKRRMMSKSPRVQYLSLLLLQTVVNNCDKAFSEVAAEPESVLDEMVKLIDDRQTVVNNRNKALMLIEAWGESTAQLSDLPAYEETYKSLKSRGIRFPGRDNQTLAPIFTPAASEVDASLAQQFQLEHDIPVQRFSAEQTKEAFDMARNCIELLSTVLSSSPQQDALEDDLITTLAQQCRESQSTVVRIIETAGDNESLLFEALNVNDEIQKALSKYEELKPPVSTPHASPGYCFT